MPCMCKLGLEGSKQPTTIGLGLWSRVSGVQGIRFRVYGLGFSGVRFRGSGLPGLR